MSGFLFYTDKRYEIRERGSKGCGGFAPAAPPLVRSATCGSLLRYTPLLLPRCFAATSQNTPFRSANSLLRCTLSLRGSGGEAPAAFTIGNLQIYRYRYFCKTAFTFVNLRVLTHVLKFNIPDITIILAESLSK